MPLSVTLPRMDVGADRPISPDAAAANAGSCEDDDDDDDNGNADARGGTLAPMPSESGLLVTENDPAAAAEPTALVTE